MVEYHYSEHWVRWLLEAIAWVSTLGSLAAIFPPIASGLGMLYWAIMLWRLLKKKKE